MLQIITVSLMYNSLHTFFNTMLEIGPAPPNSLLLSLLHSNETTWEYLNIHLLGCFIKQALRRGAGWERGWEWNQAICCMINKKETCLYSHSSLSLSLITTWLNFPWLAQGFRFTFQKVLISFSLNGSKCNTKGGLPVNTESAEFFPPPTTLSATLEMN